MAIQNTKTAYASVVLHAIGKGLGLIWAPCVMFLFPLDNFGFVFGFMQLVSIPILYVCSDFQKPSLHVNFRFFNQPMFQFNQEYGFSIMNFVVAGLCTLLLLAPIACIIRERQMRNLSAIGCDFTCSKKTNVVSPENEITTAAQ